MIDKASAHRTLKGLSWMTWRHPDINRAVDELREYVLTLEAEREVSHKGENTTSAQTLPSM